MFKKIDPKQSLPEMEKEILKFWEENKIFEKSVEKNSADKTFVFYEGPPTANGEPGLHHALARAFKDVIPRYKTMKGFRVERKAGWDTHGLPVEIQVEKELGIHNKTEIENIVPGNPRKSIIEFNKKCKKSTWKYKDLWEKLTQRMGYWVDMKNPYITYENRYIESVWWVIAQIFKTKNKKGESMIYKGHKVVPYCYRCGTTLSSHEVAQGYQTVKDNSIFVKFKLKPNQEFGGGKYKTKDSAYILVWTTTPWTLPGNVAAAVSKNVKYTSLRIKGISELLIVASDLIKKIFGDQKIEIVHDNMTGKDLLGLEYEYLYNTNDTGEKAYYIVEGDTFVTTQEGTGIVHIAPAFGADDAEVGRMNYLPTLKTVDEDGKINVDIIEGIKGVPVKKKNDKGKYKADQLIIDDLKNRELLFKEELYEHEYPFCWRCETPLIYYAKPSWFIRISELREKLYKNAKNINWVPEHIKEGRFGEWLKDAKDWAISRERYWGTPLPIWECRFKQKSKNSWEIGCGNIEIISSIQELEGKSSKKLDDLHKPYIDDVSWSCKCGGTMERVPEVLDVWFDSGSMPLAQFYYPNQATKEDKQKIESGKYFPADYISEAIDQTRGWFYTLHAIATLLYEAKKVPAGYAYKNVICLGHILDAKGKKMSKSKGNVIDPMDTMDKFGADILRWHLFTINQPGLYKRFDLKNLEEVRNRVFRMLRNSYYFFVMYANIDKFKVQSSKFKVDDFKNLLDKWIISELNVLIKKVDKGLENYDIYSSAKEVEKFIDNLSNWYIRRSRKRFWKSENDKDKSEAYQTLYKVLVELSKLMAPFTPFISEEIYKNLIQPTTNNQQPTTLSVHLADFPAADEKLIDEKLNDEMRKARETVRKGLQRRAEAGIKVRQPLSALSIKYNVLTGLLDIIKEEVNVKSVAVNKNQAENVVLNTEITEELKLEGVAREIIRHIQEMRKEAGYEVDNRIEVCYSGASEVFKKFGDLIAKEVLAEELKSGELKESDLEKDFNIEGEEVKIQIKK